MNGSDWAEVSSTIGDHAHAGDGIVFDETAHPSHRPRLALHTYPAGFARVTDLAIKTPYTRSDTWYDRAYTVDQAYDLGRFDGISRVWVVEYDGGGHVDDYGVSQLETHGYRPTGIRYRLHSDVIYLFEQQSASEQS